MIGDKRYITINTDASFCGSTKSGGYAFWIKGERIAIKKHGGFKDDVKNSTEAEMRAIANAVFVLLKRNPKNFNIIIFNTDSKQSIAHINNPLTDLAKQINNYINQLKEVTNAEMIEFRHVKAHSGKADKRSWVNEWCDVKAKEEMRKVRKRKYLNGK
jgi:ribonuclease HI